MTDEVRKRLKAKILYSHIDHKFTVETETDHITGRISPFFSSYNEALMFCGRCDLDLETMTDILEQIKCRHSMATPGPWPKRKPWRIFCRRWGKRPPLLLICG